jgi:hypothetical protein
MKYHDIFSLFLSAKLSSSPSLSFSDACERRKDKRKKIVKDGGK